MSQMSVATTVAKRSTEGTRRTSLRVVTPEEQAASAVTPGLVRLSVGLEHIDDLRADLELGFRAAKAHQ